MTFRDQLLDARARRANLIDRQELGDPLARAMVERGRAVAAILAALALYLVGVFHVARIIGEAVGRHA